MKFVLGILDSPRNHLTHVEGTGVGLYISKRLIENAGGSIAVHSQADAGALFTVTFPA